jgi:hypothetical protein
LWGGGPSLEVKDDPAPAVNDPTSGNEPTSGTEPTSGNDPTSGNKPTSHAVFGSDPYLVGLCSLSGTPLQPLPGRLADLAEYPDVERVALVAEITSLLHTNPHRTMLEALAGIDNGFIQPALAALRRGAVDNVLVVANDVQLHMRRHHRLKFWRRRPKSGGAALRALRW